MIDKKLHRYFYVGIGAVMILLAHNVISYYKLGISYHVYLLIALLLSGVIGLIIRKRRKSNETVQKIRYISFLTY